MARKALGDVVEAGFIYLQFLNCCFSDHLIFPCLSSRLLMICDYPCSSAVSFLVFPITAITAITRDSGDHGDCLIR
jgi:hypothetical protein